MKFGLIVGAILATLSFQTMLLKQAISHPHSQTRQIHPFENHHHNHHPHHKDSKNTTHHINSTILFKRRRFQREIERSRSPNCHNRTKNHQNQTNIFKHRRHHSYSRNQNKTALKSQKLFHRRHRSLSRNLNKTTQRLFKLKKNRINHDDWQNRSESLEIPHHLNRTRLDRSLSEKRFEHGSHNKTRRHHHKNPIQQLLPTLNLTKHNLTRIHIHQNHHQAPVFLHHN